jgi:hypothetical protein
MIVSIIFTIIFVGISIGCFTYALSAFHEKGPILLNGYVLATTEEKRKLARLSAEQKRKDYHHAGRAFIGLSVIFFVLSLEFLLNVFHIQANAIFLSTIISFVVILIIYVIVSDIRNGRFR